MLFYNLDSRVIIKRNLVVEVEPILIEFDETTPTTQIVFIKKKHLFVKGDQFEFRIDQEMCSNESYLMIYIHSGPKHSERRRTIRKTWAALDILKKYRARIIFITGEITDANVQVSLETESELFKDIVQANFTDTYRNLTYKAIAGLRWVSEKCPSAVYVLKTDDDIVVDIHRIVRLMRTYISDKWGTNNILAGHIWPHMDVDRNTSSKWYTSDEDFPDRFYLPYCSGSAYIMSFDVVKNFYLKSLETPFFWVDDYYVTGMLAIGANVTPISLNDRYILVNNVDIMGALKKDVKTRLVFIHSPDANTSRNVWRNYIDRW